MNKLKVYDNGLRLIVQSMPAVRSVSTGIWVGAGSSKETSATNGISHFIEHMTFKGTDKLSPFDIASAFESLGAMVNAFTGKEATCYYVKSMDANAEKCFSVLSDIFFNSSFPKEELDKERKVIREEINMVEDTPEDICYDLIARALYGENPLGMTILGPSENVARFEKTDVADYMNKGYCADNIVISMAGNVTLSQAEKWVDKYFYKFAISNKSVLVSAPKAEYKSGYRNRIKDFEQSNIAIAYPSIRYNHSKTAVQSVLNVILGGGMSSRLFQSIREQLGLAYSVYTSPSAYVNNGSFNIMLNITARNTEQTVLKVIEELEKLKKHGIEDDEFERAKAQLKTANVFSMESSQSMMTAFGKTMLLTNEIFDIDKKIREIDAVTVSDVNDFARELFDNRKVCTSYVGKSVDANVYELIRGK